MKTIKILFILSTILSANMVIAATDTQSGTTQNSSEVPVISGPLGSWDNPVKSNGPSGERAYIRQLKCPDEETPKFHRIGSSGVGPYGNILDIYELSCGNKKFDIYMDMYHCCKETRPVPGFTIETPDP
jgi:hypothetical protein